MPEPVTAIVGGAIGGAAVDWVTSSKAASAQVKGAKIAARAQEKSAEAAAAAQLEATTLGIEEQRRQFESAKEVLSPFVQVGKQALPAFAPFQEVGVSALEQQKALIGLGGVESQKEAIQQIAESPRFTTLQQQAENALLQSASATGGLRGGNLQSSLAQFRPQLLNQLINEQYSRLGGLAGSGLDVIRNLSSLGQASAAGVGSAGLSTGQAVTGLLSDQGTARANAMQQIGAARAQQALTTGAAQAAQYQAQGQAFSNIAQVIPQAMILKEFF